MEQNPKLEVKSILRPVPTKCCGSYVLLADAKSKLLKCPCGKTTMKEGK